MSLLIALKIELHLIKFVVIFYPICEVELYIILLRFDFFLLCLIAHVLMGVVSVICIFLIDLQDFLKKYRDINPFYNIFYIFFFCILCIYHIEILHVLSKFIDSL